MNFKIADVHCDACVKLSVMALKKIPGVNKAEVESDGSAEVVSDREVSREEIVNALAAVDKKADF